MQNDKYFVALREDLMKFHYVGPKTDTNGTKYNRKAI